MHVFVVLLCPEQGTTKNSVKKMAVQSRVRQKNDEIVQFLAAKWGHSASYIRKIRDGDRQHPEIFREYMELRTGLNKLLQEVNRIAPFPTTRPRRK